MSGPLLKDAKWSRQGFITSTKDMEKVDQQNRSYSSANNAFTDTTPGGSLCVNPPPQYTRYADPKATSIYSKSKGTGRFYYEQITENSQLINMRFGVPKFNSLRSFFGGFYNSAAGQLARTGRATSIFYDLGRAAGMIVGLVFWPLMVGAFIGQAINWALNKPSSKYYYLKPAMPQYWNAVQTMVNQIAVNRGITPRMGGSDKPEQRFGGPYDFTPDMLSVLNDKFPELFNKDGLLDIFAVATRAQRLATKRYKQQKAVMDNLQSTDIASVIQGLQDDKTLVDPGASFDAYKARWFASLNSQPKTASGSTDSTTENIDNSTAANAGFGSFLEGELNDGGAFVTFRVNNTGPVSESFSSSVGESEIAQKINSMSSSSRSTNFNFANGNIGGEFLQSITSSITDVVSGVGASLSLSGLATLSGAAFVDIPKSWQSSAANLPHANYTIHLGGPYGNPISQLIDIYMPLCMLLAAALPQSTGPQSYTSPLLLELYDQGRCQTRLGMIDSLSVTRGVGNLGFNNEGAYMAVEVNFSIVDMSSVLHMPIAEGLNMNGLQAGANIGAVAGAVAAGPVGAAAGTVAGGTIGAAVDAVDAVATTIGSFFDDETVFTDYMAVLGSMNLPDQIYFWRRLKVKLTQASANLKTFFSAAHYASYAGDTMPARLISAIYKGTER